MPTISFKQGRHRTFLTFGADWKPGDQPPAGYLDWHEWAEVQHKAGLRQTQCGKCDGWKYPQEMSVKTTTIKGFKNKAMTKPIEITLRVCNSCAGTKPSPSGDQQP